jgi:hypothetical protein
VPILAARSTLQALQEIKSHALAKLELINYDLAREELLPYLPTDVRDQLTRDRSIEHTLTVGTAIEHWCDQAIAAHRERGAT